MAISKKLLCIFVAFCFCFRISQQKLNYEVPKEPKAKQVIRDMDEIISNHVHWDNWNKWHAIMQQYFVKDFKYDTNFSPNEDLGKSIGIRQWYDKEHIPFNLAFKNVTFNQLIFAGEDYTATTTTYALAYWAGPIATIQPTNKVVKIRIYDFYEMEKSDPEKIKYNWMILDTVGLMLQSGYRVLPKPYLPEGIFLPPQSMDGIPAPLSMYTNVNDSEQSKRIVEEASFYDWISGTQKASSRWTANMRWYGSTGIGMANSKSEYEKYFLAPLRKAFSHRRLHVNVLTCEGSFCGMNGHLMAIHTGQWLGEKASNRYVKLRFGLHFRVDLHTGTIPEGYGMFDLPDFFIQIGVNLYDRLSKDYKIRY